MSLASHESVWRCSLTNMYVLLRIAPFRAHSSYTFYASRVDLIRDLRAAEKLLVTALFEIRFEHIVSNKSQQLLPKGSFEVCYPSFNGVVQNSRSLHIRRMFLPFFNSFEINVVLCPMTSQNVFTVGGP